jgi:formylglycine-generating enzyme required for sulfatase activity
VIATTAPSSPPAPPTPASVHVSCPDGMVGVSAPTATASSAAQPPAPFCIDATEVTAADYAACIEADTCHPLIESCMPSAPLDDGKFPALCVPWGDASAYCASKGKRLPTEPEWVLAACGTDGRTYPWGNDKPTNQVCWMGEPGGFRGTTQRGPCRVGSFPAGRSPYGMLDAAGSVAEWTATAEGKYDHVIRGGGFGESWRTMQCATRLSDSNPNMYRGFRCAMAAR